MRLRLTTLEGINMRELATSRRLHFFTRAGQFVPTAALALVLAGGCGSVNSAGGDAAAGTSGQSGRAGGAGGSSGSGGSGGSGGSDSGSSGSGGSDSQLIDSPVDSGSDTNAPIESDTGSGP